MEPVLRPTEPLPPAPSLRTRLFIAYGAVLLTAGHKGKRYILPHAKVMIHQPYGGVSGQAEDIRIQAEQIIKAKAELIRIIANHTGQSIENIRRDSERDKYFTAEEAVKYGIIDEVLSEPPKTSVIAPGVR